LREGEEVLFPNVYTSAGMNFVSGSIALGDPSDSIPSPSGVFIIAGVYRNAKSFFISFSTGYWGKGVKFIILYWCGILICYKT
jgi:hypothetical protein